MVKLTPELLAQAPSAINPIRERQLDLRGESATSISQVSLMHRKGYKIPTIENLGVSKACISDHTDRKSVV